MQKKIIILLVNATVAQLDRVLGYEPSGQGFESLQLHHICGSRECHNKNRLGKPSLFFAPKHSPLKVSKK